MAKETQEVENQEVKEPTIGLKDLVIAKEAIQVASNRGAFRAEEMSTIGTTFDRLVAYINFHAPKPEEKESDSGTEEPKESE